MAPLHRYQYADYSQLHEPFESFMSQLDIISPL